MRVRCTIFPCVSFFHLHLTVNAGRIEWETEKNMAQPNNNAIQFQSSGWSLSFYLSVVLFFFSLSFILFLSGNIIPTIVHRHHNTTIVRESIRSLALSPLIGLHLNNSK